MRLPERYKSLHLSLDEFVAAANDLLPDILPEDISDQRIKEALSPRLVRHYSSQGSLEEPLKEGREARYTYRHLLQLLSLRSLQAQGYRTTSVSALLAGMSDSELEDLLSGDRQVSLSQEPSHQSTNSAVDFLQSLRSGTHPAVEIPIHRPSSPTNPSAPTKVLRTKPRIWFHHELAPGLILEVRDDFQNPPDPTALLTEFIKALRARKSSK